VYGSEREGISTQPFTGLEHCHNVFRGNVYLDMVGRCQDVATAARKSAQAAPYVLFHLFSGSG
jgi:hypothetical protein